MVRFMMTIAGIILFLLGGIMTARTLALMNSAKTDPSTFFSKSFEVVAHRGGSAEAPENTFAAFDNAAKLSPDVIFEMDVHLTKDGELVVHHDSTLERTTNGTGHIKEFTLKELQTLDAGYNFKNEKGEFSFRGKGVQIPTLKQVLERYPNRRLIIEVKDDAFEIENRITDMIKEAQAQDRVMLGSQNGLIAMRLRRVAPTWNFCASQDEVLRTVMLMGLYLEPMAVMNSNAYLIPEKDKGIPVFSERLRDELHRRGKKVLIWTVNDEADMKRLISQGVDGLITDRPSFLLSLKSGS